MARNTYRDKLSILEGGYGVTGHAFNEVTGQWEYLDEDGKTASQVLAEYQEHANRLNAISGVYQRADRIITGQDVIVEAVSDPKMNSQASNSGRNIKFNIDMIDTLDTDSIIALHGLNYHEVSHLLFSPRAGSDLARYVKDNNFKRAFFMLEDMRAENLLVTKYPIVSKFLEASVMRYLLEDITNAGEYFPLITGRKYLPLELRQFIADRALETMDNDKVKELHSVIHEYRTLVFPRDFDKAKELITRMANVVGRDGSGCFPQWESSEDFMKEGRPLNTKEQERLQDRDKSKDIETESLEGERGNPNDNQDIDGNGNNHKGYGQGGANENTILKGNDTTLDDSISALAEYLTDRMDDIREDKFVKREVADTRKAIIGSDEMKLSMKDTAYTPMPIQPSAQSIARKFSQELQQLVLDQDPQWETERPYGKLVPKRTMTPDINAIGRVFDRWNIGNENTEIEAVILLDNSSSMHGLMQTVCESAWVLKRGIEAIHGKATIYSFNHESKLLYSSADRAKPNELRYVYASGNTNPIRALVEAERLLTTTRKPIKLLFVVTDGEWAMDNECNSIIKNMNDNGVITSLVFLNDSRYYEDITTELRNTTDPERLEYFKERLVRIAHGVKIFNAVAQTKDILTVGKSLVKEVVSERRIA